MVNLTTLAPDIVAAVLDDALPVLAVFDGLPAKAAKGSILFAPMGK